MRVVLCYEGNLSVVILRDRIEISHPKRLVN